MYGQRFCDFNDFHFQPFNCDGSVCRLCILNTLFDFTYYAHRVKFGECLEATYLPTYINNQSGNFHRDYLPQRLPTKFSQRLPTMETTYLPTYINNQPGNFHRHLFFECNILSFVKNNILSFVKNKCFKQIQFLPRTHV